MSNQLRYDRINPIKLTIHMTTNNKNSEITKELNATGIEKGIRIVSDSIQEDYDKAREISNSYFNYFPVAIAFPKTTEEVSVMIKEFNKKNKSRSLDDKIPLRIMSGGHQHEGMSSADDSFVIRLSNLGKIEYNSNKTEAWIPTGMKLEVAYDKLEEYKKTIPGGGCMNVNVGGLTQGGGWGMNARKDGLTCDNILAAEVVLANGDIVQASKKVHPKLFWAIRGGGGGNFGIVTRFLFKLQDISPEICVFRFFWKHDQMENAIAAFLEEQKKFPNELTSFLRVTAVAKPIDGEYKKDYPVYASGLYHGRLASLMELLEPLADKTNPQNPEYSVRSLEGYTNEELKAVRKFTGFDIMSSQNIKVNQNTSIIDLFNYDVFDDSIDKEEINESSKKCLVDPPESNCSSPHPHKVSSGFSNKTKGQTDSQYYNDIAKVVSDYFANSINGSYKEHLPYVRSYMTIHSMGGAMSKEPDGGSAFAFRDTEFLLQFQSWWDYPKGSEASCQADREWPQDYIDWVINLRAILQKEALIEGAFINFVDKTLVKELKTNKDKFELLKFYYGDKLDKLMDIKSTYDPENCFNFSMSIPIKSKEK